jgi:hypothetical protein
MNTQPVTNIRVSHSPLTSLANGKMFDLNSVIDSPSLTCATKILYTLYSRAGSKL